jgi:hypothetical protein
MELGIMVVGEKRKSGGVKFGNQRLRNKMSKTNE